MYKVHFAGDFPPDLVATTWSGGARPTNFRIEAAIESAWSAAQSRPGIHLFDGQLIRLESWTIEGGRLNLTIGGTGYKPFFGTNLSHPEFAGEYGPEFLANALGVSAALQCGDGHLLLGVRNANVAYYPHRIHTFAGSVSETDIFAAMRRELREELGLSAADISHIRCIGLAEDSTIRQPELIFSVQATPTRQQLESRLDLTEHSGLWSIPARPADLDAAAQNERLTPIARATLSLWRAGGNL